MQFHFVSVLKIQVLCLNFSRATEATYSAGAEGRSLLDARSASPEPSCFYNLKAMTLLSC